MVAALDDLAVLQHHDGVGVADGGQPVSMELVASSRISTGGSATAARAMASSCRWPWDRLAPSEVIRVS